MVEKYHVRFCLFVCYVVFSKWQSNLASKISVGKWIGIAGVSV